MLVETKAGLPTRTNFSGMYQFWPLITFSLISCAGVTILEDVGIFSARRLFFVLFLSVFPKSPRILQLQPVRVLRAAINSPQYAMNKC